MKKKWVFILGILTGIVVTYLFAIIFSKMSRDDDLSFFEKPGNPVEYSSVKVFQALGDGFALGNCEGVTKEIITNDNDDDYVDVVRVSSNYLLTTIVLLYNEEGTPYYDDQIVRASKDQCFKQVGIYHYPTKSGDKKTVPIVMLMDK